MRLSRKLGPILTISLLLVAHPGRVRQAFGEQQAAPDKPTLETRGSDWTLQLSPFDGRFLISHKGVQVISTQNLYFGAKFAWVNSTFRFEPAAPGRYTLVGEAPGLKLRVSGELQSTSPNVLQMDIVVQADQAMHDVIGGGWEWSFKLDSPALGARSNPELLPDNRGWTWPVGTGQAITLRYNPPAGKILFERGSKGQIRTYFVADEFERGPHRFRVTLELPEGARLLPSSEERYDAPDPRTWIAGALAADNAPVDLSFLNKDDRPAGRRGFVRADGDRLVFADGTPARFWGGNIVAGLLYGTPRPEVARQARRIARLGYNLMRFHHHDSDWVNPNIFGNKARTTRHLDPRSLDALDWWIKCLEDEGIYVWLDMHVGRIFLPADGLEEQAEDFFKQKRATANDFCYYNGQLRDLMKEFQHNYLNHLNRYTNRRYKDDPGIMGILITNENDATAHGCYSVLPDHGFPQLNAVWTKAYKEFGRAHGLPEARIFQTWAPGPSKIFLAQVEHDFNTEMIADLKEIGVKAPIATTDFWGYNPLYCLPSLADGDLIDVHTYGREGELEKNAHYEGNFLTWIAMGQVYDKPLAITEWNVEPWRGQRTKAPVDRFTTPLYMAGVASLQGWDAPMIFNYSQTPFGPTRGMDIYSTYDDPAITGIMPAAALLYRQGHVSPAKKTYCFQPDAATFFGRALDPNTSATIRTLAEQSKLTIGMPDVRELPWVKPSRPSSDVIVVTDPDRDFIPPGQSFVRSDTDELTRDWEQGIHTIDTPRTQAVSGWIGGKSLKTRDAQFDTRTRNAVIALTSVDNRPLAESRFILVTAIARAVASPGNKTPFLSEMVASRITLRTHNPDLEMLALGRDGRVVGRPAIDREGDSLSFRIPSGGGAHWYVIKTPSASRAKPAAASGDRAPQEKQ